MGMTDEEVVLHDNLNSLKANLKKVETGKIVLIGDIMLDCYIHGFANNLNSRAPVPVIRETRREEDVGAAAHVARGLESMGFESQIFGVIGDDRPGMSILEFLVVRSPHRRYRSTQVAAVEGVEGGRKRRSDTNAPPDDPNMQCRHAPQCLRTPLSETRALTQTWRPRRH